jgi:hypothetical protein
MIESKDPLQFVDLGIGPIKSMSIDSHEYPETSNEFNNPYSFWLLGLLRWQVQHVLQKDLVSETISCHQM